MKGLPEISPADFPSLAVCLDFDGTLTEIVERPELAVPLEGMVETLADLSELVLAVAVISGRPVEYLVRRLPGLPKVRYLGLYGTAELVAGQVVLEPAAARLRPAVEAATSQLRADPAVGESGALIEVKPLSVAVHLRQLPPAERDRWREPLRAAATAAAERHGLKLEGGRLVWELSVPNASDKGLAVRRVVRESGARSLVVVGDDLGDIPAFVEAARLRDEGIRAVRVAVASDEAPGALLSAADHIVDGPKAVLALLRDLADAR